MANLPEIVSAGGQAAEATISGFALYLGIKNARSQAAAQFPGLLEELSSLSDDQLRDLVEDNPAIAELVGTAWESAARTAAEDKRWMLAKVVASALSFTTTEEVDPYAQLVRTVGVIEPPETRLLAILATPTVRAGRWAGTALEGALTLEDLRDVWQGAADMLLPMLAVLTREGLIYDASVGRIQAEASWRVTPYGFRLLRFLPGDTSWLDRAEISIVLSGDDVIVVNLGPGHATNIMVSLTAEWDDGHSEFREGHPPEPFQLGPGNERSASVSAPPYEAKATWFDTVDRERTFKLSDPLPTPFAKPGSRMRGPRS